MAGVHDDQASFFLTAHAKDIYLPSLNPAGLLRRKMDAARFIITCTDAKSRLYGEPGEQDPGLLAFITDSTLSSATHERAARAFTRQMGTSGFWESAA